MKKRKIVKTGNSLAVIIPAEIAKKYLLSAGKSLDISEDFGKMSVFLENQDLKSTDKNSKSTDKNLENTDIKIGRRRRSEGEFWS